MGILLIVLVINIIIFAHELGHFLAAKSLGLPVEKFAIGFGPSLIKWKRRETEYSFNIILLGGYVAFPVDDPNVPIDPNDKTKLVNRTVLERAFVMGAGVIGNFILAYLVLLISVSLLGIASGIEKVAVYEAMPNSPAQKAGLLPKDLILQVGDRSIKNFNELREALRFYAEKPVPVTVLRENQQKVIQATPDATGKLGFRPQIEVIKKYPHNPLEGIVYAGQELVNMTKAILTGLWMLVSGKLGWNDLAGPVMIVAVGQDVAKENIGNVLIFMALISIDIALINVLPLPALDGGRLFFLAIEAIIRRPVPQRIEEMVHRVGLVLLLTLGIFIIFKDIFTLLKIGQ